MTDIVEPVVDRCELKKIVKLLGEIIGGQVESYIRDGIVPRSVLFCVVIHII